MITTVEGILFTDGPNRVLMHPPKQDGGSGFHHLVELVGGPFHGAIDASSYERPTGLRFFHQELVALHQNLAGEARLPQSYDNFALSLRGDGKGHITVQVEAIAHHFMGIRLSFSFVIDQTQLPPIIASVERFFLNVE